MKNIRIYLESLSQRWVVTLMSMLGVALEFTMRACLSITMTQMVKPVPAYSKDANQYGICPLPSASVHPMHKIIGQNSSSWCNDRFLWDEETQGMVLSAFYYGYIITHVPGGLLAQRFGGKFTMAYAILSTSTLALLTPTVARMGPKWLMILRFVEGLGEGITFPALCSLLAYWAPPLEKGKLSTLVFSGSPIGNICAYLFSGAIMYYIPGGWPHVFYCFGTIGLVWFVVWLMIVYNDPDSNPFISAEECKYLHETIGYVERNKDLANTPWMSILLAPTVWALVVAEIGFDWCAYTIVNDLPKYMNDVLHFSIKENGVLSATPYLAQWIMSIVSNMLADYMIQNQFLTVTQARKIYAIIGTVGPGLGVMGASFVGCNKIAAIFCFTLGMALMGFCNSSVRINSLDLSPKYSASIMALVNGIGCLSGMASPYVVGILTPNRTIFEWRLVFWIMLITLATASLIFTIFGSGELQHWDSGKVSSSTVNISKTTTNKVENDQFLFQPV